MNDTTPTKAGEGGIVVRHTAAAPAVDVYAGETKVISSLENPDSAGPLYVPAGTVSASVTAAGATDPVIGPADVPVEEGNVTIVYAIGSLEADTLGVAVQSPSRSAWKPPRRPRPRPRPRPPPPRSRAG